MGKITETSRWETEVFAVDLSTPVIGGQPEWQGNNPTAGFANAGTQQLANRTQFLNDQRQEIESDLSNLTNEVNSNQLEAENHYGSGGDAHARATQFAHGFMSNTDKIKIDNLADVAESGDYDDLLNKPNLTFFFRTIDFEARVGENYYVGQSLNITLGDPELFGWVAGNSIHINKSPDATALITASEGRTIITAIGTDTSVIYDVEDDILVVYDGTNWRVQ